MKCLEALKITQLTGKQFNSTCFEIANAESSIDPLTVSSYLQTSNFIIQSKQETEQNLMPDHFVAKVKQEDFFCANCCKRRAEKELIGLHKKKMELNQNKDSLRTTLLKNKRGEKELTVAAKAFQLDILLAKNKKLKEQLDVIRKGREDEMSQSVQMKQKLLERRELELKEVQESIQYKESKLLSLRSDLRELQAKRILKVYSLYELNATFPNYSFSSVLQRETYNTISSTQSDTPFLDTKILLRRNFFDEHIRPDLLGSVQLFHSIRPEDDLIKTQKQIIASYSLQNILRFLHEVILTKGFLSPFPSFLDQNKFPYYYVGMVIAKEVSEVTQKQFQSGNRSILGRKSQQSQNAMEQIQLQSAKSTKKKKQQFRQILESIAQINDEELIFPWINFAVLIKQLGLKFSDEVLKDTSMTFNFAPIKELFERELLMLPRQLDQKENKVQVNSSNDLTISSEFLRIIYPKNGLEQIIDEDVNDFINQEGNRMQIIQITELRSRIIHTISIEHDDSQFEQLINTTEETLQKSKINQESQFNNRDVDSSEEKVNDDDDDDDYEII